MARKKLLTEGEIRHFMKLANLTPLTETYLSEQPEMEMDPHVDPEMEPEIDAVPDEEPEMPVETEIQPTENDSDDS